MLTDIKVIDNFLNPIYHNEILKSLESPFTDWYLQKNLSIGNDKGNPKSFGFNRWYFDENGWRPSSAVDFIKPLVFNIMDEVNSIQPIRVRADMTMQSDDNHKHQVHIDYPTPNITTIFYVNESDGNTIFFDERTNETEKRYDISNLKIKDEIEPRPNRLVIFDGFQLHTGCSPKNYSNRILINSNYLV